MDPHRPPPEARLAEEKIAAEKADAEALRAIALRRARLSVHMRRHERPLAK